MCGEIFKAHRRDAIYCRKHRNSSRARKEVKRRTVRWMIDDRPGLRLMLESPQPHKSGGPGD